MIYTVTGAIKKEDLGFTLPHEHILCDLRPSLSENGAGEHFKEKLGLTNRYAVYSDPYTLEDNAYYLDEEIAVKELEFYKKAGGKSIFDCTTFFRNHRALKRISERTGINVILGCGRYTDPFLSEADRNATAEELCREMVEELTEGIGQSGIKAGFIGEVGTSAEITKDEWKNVIAAGLASMETGAAIHFHTALWEENGLKIAKELIGMGVKPQKICIDHIDVCLRQDYLLKLLDMGVYVEYDNFGKEFFIPKRETGLLRGRFAYDYERCLSVKAMCDRGYENRLLITTDICLKSMLYNYGGNGFAHIPVNITVMLKDAGLTETQVKRLTQINPAEFFDR